MAEAVATQPIVTCEPVLFLEEVVIYLDVDYEQETVHHPEEMHHIFFSSSGYLGDPQKPRQIRWVVRGLEDGDTLKICPKPGHSTLVFNPENGGCFEIPSDLNSVASGLPMNPTFTPNAEGRKEMLWAYDLQVWRGGCKLFEKDPELCIVEDD